MGRIFMKKSERIALEQAEASRMAVESDPVEAGALGTCSVADCAENDRVRLTCDIARRHHLALKYAAMMSGKTMVETIESLIEDNLQPPDKRG